MKKFYNKNHSLLMLVLNLLFWTAVVFAFDISTFENHLQHMAYVVIGYFWALWNLIPNKNYKGEYE